MKADEADTARKGEHVSQEPQNRRGRQDRDWSGLLLPTALILGLVLLLSLNVDVSGVADEPAEVNPLEGPLKLVVGYFAAGAEIAAAVVIGVGILHGVVGYARFLFAASAAEGSATESIRLRLGRVLTTGSLHRRQRHLAYRCGPDAAGHLKFGYHRPPADASQLFFGAGDRAGRGEARGLRQLEAELDAVSV